MAQDRIAIVALAEAHRADWRRLYDGYATFYKRAMTDEIAANVWAWLMDQDHPLEGLGALRDDRPVGLAHFRAMPSPLRGAEIGFLDDLFVDPDQRGGQIGAKLIERVGSIGGDRGWSCLRWLTADDNYRARTLYDRLARKTAWNLYEMDC